MIDGLLVIDKPEGLTSHDVVQRVRRWAKQRRVGHLGTLDPLATGVLPIALGEATKLSQRSRTATRSTAARSGSASRRPPTTARASVGAAPRALARREEVLKALDAFQGEITRCRRRSRR